MGSMRESHTQTNGLWLFQSIPSIGKYDELKTFSCHYVSFSSNSYSPSLLDFDFHPHIHSFSAPKMMPLSTMMVLVYSLDNSTM